MVGHGSARPSRDRHCGEGRGLARRGMAAQGAERQCEARFITKTSHTTHATRYSPATCTHCGRSIVGLPRESQQFGIVPAECQACYKRRLVTDLQQQIADKQRKGTR